MKSIDHAVEAIRAIDDPAVIIGFEPGAIDRTLVAGPLSGEAIVVKDNIAVPGHPMTGGSPALVEHVEPVGDGVSRLLAAGAVIVATASLHELAFGVTGENRWRGTPMNPIAPDRLPGGSSSGPAVAVARGIVGAAIGTDTGGSIRIPAACCGVHGFRPTTGRYPSNGVLTLSPSRDTIGVLASNLETIARFDAVLAEDTNPDPVDGAPGSVRIAVLDDVGIARCDTPVADAYRRWVEACIDAGAETSVIDIGDLLALNDEASFPIALRETILQFRGRAAAMGVTYDELVESLANDDVRGLMSMDPPPEVARIDALERIVPMMREWYDEALSGSDVIALPTMPVLPPLRNETMTMRVGDQDLPTFQTLATFTSPASLAGVPSLSVPIRCEEGPVAVMLEARPGADRTLLATARRLAEVER